MSVYTYTQSELPVVVSAFLDHLGTYSPVVVALHGDLGAGKTTFVQELARQLGVTETVTSPTFTIMKSYETSSEVFPTLVHIDAYRFESIDEARPLQLSKIFGTPGVLVCVEWPERIESMLPADSVVVQLSVIDEHTRSMRVEVA